MRDCLGVRIADKFATVFGQPLAQLTKILNYAIVNHRDRVCGMRVRIIFTRPAMGRPTGVANADSPAQRFTLEPRFQRAQFAFGAPSPKDTALESCDARGIIAAVFKALEGINQLPSNRLCAQNSHDSAHPFGWPLCPSIMV
jgi:hypothetical protein